MTSLPFPGTPQSRRETLSFILIGENGARLDRPNPSIMEQMESSIESIGFSLASSSSLLILHPRSTPICNTVRNSNCSDRGREREREARSLRLDREEFPARNRISDRIRITIEKFVSRIGWNFPSRSRWKKGGGFPQELGRGGRGRRGGEGLEERGRPRSRIRNRRS